MLTPLCRDLSTLEKIFEYFATNEKDGRKAMSAQDVVRALVPTYPPVGSTVERAGFLAGESPQGANPGSASATSTSMPGTLFKLMVSCQTSLHGTTGRLTCACTPTAIHAHSHPSGAALVPFCACPGERGHSQVAQTAHDAIISFFDHNKDGVIGFDEFVLIVIAMSVPEKDVDVVFDVIDLDNNGVLDADEFMQVCGRTD